MSNKESNEVLLMKQGLPALVNCARTRRNRDVASIWRCPQSWSPTTGPHVPVCVRVYVCVCVRVCFGIDACICMYVYDYVAEVWTHKYVLTNIIFSM